MIKISNLNSLTYYLSVFNCVSVLWSVKLEKKLFYSCKGNPNLILYFRNFCQIINLIFARKRCCGSTRSCQFLTQFEPEPEPRKNRLQLYLKKIKMVENHWIFYDVFLKIFHIIQVYFTMHIFMSFLILWFVKMLPHLKLMY